ncbi:MAG: DNA-deoxyinosine glycosylase [Sulfurimonadaceae bacterium]|nr:DNA-deoxyinosine glycosylase [Sulfurimonadaceae bacterium]
MKQTHPFDPIVDDRSKVLILGSFPSLKSFENDFYYAHPRNQFWPIISRLFNTELATNDDRLELLLKEGIALWDVYGALTRSDSNSSDANLKDLVPNDIPALLKRYPGIRMIFCTGKKAYDGLKKSFPSIDIDVKLLPSTSPAYASMTFEKKLQAYAEVKASLV